jgi:hypothetical protein
MMDPLKILFRSLVKPFYQENGGFFLFFFIFMFFIVGHLNGAGLYEYHYFLVLEMMRNGYFLIFVFFVWFLYWRKSVSFIKKKMRRDDYQFLYIFNCLNKTKRFRLFLFVNVILFLPILLYGLFVVISAILAGFFRSPAIVLVYMLVLLVLSVLSNTRTLDRMLKKARLFENRLRMDSILPVTYPLILLGFVGNTQKMIWLGIKIFTCGILFGILRNNVAGDYDIKLAFVFYIFGILANGFIVFKVRAFEERHLSFYRGLPISNTKRFSGYCLFYFVLLVPEFLTLGLLVPQHLLVGDGVTFMLTGYFTILLLNSIMFTGIMRIRELLMILLLVGSLLYVFLLSGIIVYLYLTFFLLSVVLFFIYYLKFENK